MKYLLLILFLTLSAVTNPLFAQQQTDSARKKKMSWREKQMQQKERFLQKRQHKCDLASQPSKHHLSRYDFHKADPTNPLYLAHRLFVKIALQGLADNHGPTLPVGLEYRFNKGWAVVADVGIPLGYRFDKNKTITVDMIAHLELRRYYNIRRKSRVFLGLEAFGRHQDFNMHYGDYTKISFAHYSFKDGAVHKSSAGMSALIGINIIALKNVFVDLYAGFGIKYLQTDYYALQHLEYISDEGTGIGLLLTDEDHFSGSITRPYLPWGVKIGYLIPKKKKRS